MIETCAVEDGAAAPAGGSRPRDASPCGVSSVMAVDPGEGNCWACKAIRGEVPASIVEETPGVVTLVNPRPLVPGTMLIVPRRHVPTLYDLPDELAGPILVTARRAARALKTALAADGVALRQHNERAAGQEVFHFHLHVIPRFAGDAERFAAPPQWISLEEQRSLSERLRAAMGGAR